MADANMLSSSTSLAVLLLSALLPAVCGEISSTITSSNGHYNLTLASPTDEMYLSRPLYVTISAHPVFPPDLVDSSKLRDYYDRVSGEIRSQHINLAISTNNSQVIGIPAETTLPLSMDGNDFKAMYNVTQETPLFSEPINLTVIVTEIEDSDNSMSITLLLIDDRGEIV